MSATARVLTYTALPFALCTVFSGCADYQASSLASRAEAAAALSYGGATHMAENEGPRALRVIKGDIDLADGSSTKDIAVVRGSINSGEQVTVTGDVRVLEGKATLRAGTRITGNLTTIYGEVALAGVRIDNGIHSFCSRLTIEGGEISGQLRIEKSWMSRSKCEGPKELTIGRGARIHSIWVEDPNVQIRVHRSAEIGELKGAVPVYFE
jgi:hypothetical protein